MKKIYILLVAAIVLLAIQSNAQVNSFASQQPVPKPNITIPFGKKLPSPNFIKFQSNSLPGNARFMQSNMNAMGIKDFNANDIKKDPARFKQMLLQMRNTMFAPNTMHAVNSADENRSSNFHLTKDINAQANSYPESPSEFYFKSPFAILNNIIYFGADDGIHGTELWRSDGTEAGTYMVKDIVRGEASSVPLDITAINDKIYFSARDTNNVNEAWISDGTTSGTKPLININIGSGFIASNATEFTALGNDVYFVTDGGNFSSWGALWKTDGTRKGTKLVTNLADSINGGSVILQLTQSNGLLFFTLINNATGAYELWRSDGTNTSTYHVATNTTFADIPLQLTAYNNKFYFSSDDGSGRKLWVSDGTDAGTMLAPGNNNMLLDVDYGFGPFTIFNNVMYMPANSQLSGDMMYKYDATDNAGLIKLKDFTEDSGFIVRYEMTVVGNTLYFKVSGSAGGLHDELWSTKGDKESTKLVNKFHPNELISYLYNGSNHLYFDKYDKFFGSELWTLVETPFVGFPLLVRDIFSGPASSSPGYLTTFKGKLFFSATDNKKGNELFMTNDLGIIHGATLVKDINSVATDGSYAGVNNLMTSLGNDVIFNAQDYVHGAELYNSDGTEKGTYLLNDISQGMGSSNPALFLSKKNAVYFLAQPLNASNTSLLLSINKTNGKPAGLQKITPDIPSSNGYILNYDVANNNLVFYVVFDFSTGAYELWRSDGTTAGTFILSSTVYSTDNLHITGNIAFFVAGDAEHGYELWKSDGSTSGTVMVKDINHGVSGSYPGGLFVYKNEVYFGANDGTSSNNGTGAGFWKSNGTAAGTVKLKNIDPWYGSDAFSTGRFFCISNGILYLSALRYADGNGTELWKTDGTSNGTKIVRDVNPYDNSVTPGPYYLTDVDGTIFFTADDGVHGTELWKTDGSYDGTQLVKDITTGSTGSSFNYLVSYAGKLYFIVSTLDIYSNITGTSLWLSNGTENGTSAVNDPIVNELFIYNMIAASSQLFLSGYTHQYGIELYVGTLTNDGKFAATSITNNAIKATDNNMLLYPNPAKDVLNINLGSINISKATLQITNVAGNILINKQVDESNKQNVLQVNVSQLAAGSYFIKIISADGSEKAVKKFIKQ